MVPLSVVQLASLVLMSQEIRNDVIKKMPAFETLLQRVWENCIKRSFAGFNRCSVQVLLPLIEKKRDTAN